MPLPCDSLSFSKKNGSDDERQIKRPPARMEEMRRLSSSAYQRRTVLLVARRPCWKRQARVQSRRDFFFLGALKTGWKRFRRIYSTALSETNRVLDLWGLDFGDQSSFSVSLSPVPSSGWERRGGERAFSESSRGNGRRTGLKIASVKVHHDFRD